MEEVEYLKFLGIDIDKDITFGDINKKYRILKMKKKNDVEFCKKLDDIYNYFNTNGVYSNMDKAQEIFQQVFLGSVKLAYDLERLNSYKITHIISIAEEFPTKFPNFVNKNAGLPDSSMIDINKEWLENCYFYIKNAISENKDNKVLIHCQFGRTRSAIVATYFLSKILNINITSAYEKLKTIRDVMIPENIIELMKKF